jgi:hypothetical protein
MISGNPSTLKMHMTGMESFNAVSKRGTVAIPMNSTSNSGSATTAGIDNSHQAMTDNKTIVLNKSNMCKSQTLIYRILSEAILNNKNKNQPKNNSVVPVQGKPG